MYSFLCNYFLHLFLVVSILYTYIIIFTRYGTRVAVPRRAAFDRPVACECKDGKRVTAWNSGPGTGGLLRVQGEVYTYFYSILLFFVILYLFIFYQICYLY
jgi:hypothetical protein